MRTMHMLHPLDIAVYDPGSTVRLGFKWADVYHGEQLVLCVCTARCEYNDGCGIAQPGSAYVYMRVRERVGWLREVDGVGDRWACGTCTPSGVGIVDKPIWVGRFNDMPARVIADEHEYASRTYHGLAESMTRAYGDAFTLDAFVTVIRYTRVS